LTTTTQLPTDSFDAIVLGVAHKEFTTMDLSKLKRPNGVLFDVKGVLTEKADGRL
jgi:UDP-N-acetyl-D-galactosamine dehydrogenase